MVLVCVRGAGGVAALLVLLLECVGGDNGDVLLVVEKEVVLECDGGGVGDVLLVVEEEVVVLLILPVVLLV